MATNSTLTEDNHATSQDIRTFNGDTNWRTLIATGNKVSWAQTDTFTPRNIHRVHHGALASVGTVIFNNGR
ncbi:Uncharacterised protein [Yersinia enterocolitica]|nr:Uncharacterised protein [Yersinia enterocolitica]